MLAYVGLAKPSSGNQKWEHFGFTKGVDEIMHLENWWRKWRGDNIEHSLVDANWERQVSVSKRQSWGIPSRWDWFEEVHLKHFLNYCFLNWHAFGPAPWSTELIGLTSQNWELFMTLGDSEWAKWSPAPLLTLKHLKYILSVCLIYFSQIDFLSPAIRESVLVESVNVFVVVHSDSLWFSTRKNDSSGLTEAPALNQVVLIYDKTMPLSSSFWNGDVELSPTAPVGCMYDRDWQSFSVYWFWRLLEYVRRSN